MDLIVGTILQNPKSRLVPVGVEVIFRCKQAGTLNPGWKINNRTYYPHDDVERQGFYIDQQEEGSNVTLTLRMNATLDKNNTEIHCSSLFVESPQVILVVITSINFLILCNSLKFYMIVFNRTCFATKSNNCKSKCIVHFDTMVSTLPLAWAGD